MGAAGRRGSHQVAERNVVLGDGRAHLRHLLAQCRLTRGGHQQHPGPVLRRRARGRRSRFHGRRRLHDDVHVRAAEPEGADARAQRPSPAGQVDVAERHAHGPAAPVDRGVRALDAGLRGDPSGGDHPDRLQQATDAGRRVHVPEYRLVRAHEHGGVRGTPRPVHLAQRLHLDEVADRRPGAVRLDVVHLVRGESGPVQGAPQQVALSGGIRHRQAQTGAVVVHGRPADDGVDPVAGRHGVGVPLEDDHAAALTTDDAVGGGVERPAGPGRGQRADAAEEHTQVRRDEQADAAGDGRVAVPGTQALGRLMHGQQGGGAGGIDRRHRPAEVEGVGETAGGEAELHAAHVVRADTVQAEGPGVQQLVVLGEHAQHHGGTRAAPLLAGAARVGHRLPGHLHHQALLRVQHARLTRCDAEEGGVEPVDVLQEDAHAVGDGARPAGRVGTLRPPPLRRHVGEQVGAAAQQTPEGAESPHPARETAADADDGYRRSEISWRSGRHVLPLRMVEVISFGKAGKTTPRADVRIAPQQFRKARKADSEKADWRHEITVGRSWSQPLSVPYGQVPTAGPARGRTPIAGPRPPVG